MRLPKRGERGFTLIELLIVVAILGVLAAVIIPNLQRFIGAGEEEAQAAELANIQASVSAMMIDNMIASLDNPVADADSDPLNGIQGTNDMGAFPDITTARTVQGTESYSQLGFRLYAHEIGYDGSDPLDGIIESVKFVNYVAQQQTAYFYIVDAQGMVSQSVDETFPTP